MPVTSPKPHQNPIPHNSTDSGNPRQFQSSLSPNHDKRQTIVSNPRPTPNDTSPTLEMSTADIKQVSFGSGKRDVPLKKASKWYPSQEDAEPKKVGFLYLRCGQCGGATRGELDSGPHTSCCSSYGKLRKNRGRAWELWESSGGGFRLQLAQRT